jgi:hypothetical protein
MPYALEKVGGKFKVINKDSGKVHAKGTSSKNAKKQMRLLQGIEHGMKLRSQK